MAIFLMGSIFSALGVILGCLFLQGQIQGLLMGATKSLKDALTISFNGGAVMGKDRSITRINRIRRRFFSFDGNVEIMSGYAMGASFAALFARVGGGIFTKAADIGADLVGKVEANIPEDDPRNPAVIADNVGDNVGDVAGMGADLYESYVGSIFASVLGGIDYSVKGSIFPFFVASSGLILSILGIILVNLFIKRSDNVEPQKR